MQSSVSTRAEKGIIPLSRPTLGRNDLKSVLECMVQEDLSFGSVVLNYERELAKGLEFAHALSVSSLMAAYHISFLALAESLEAPKNEVLLLDFAPVEALDAAKLAGFEVKVCDIGRDSLHPNDSQVLEAITEKTGIVVLQYPFGVYHDYIALRAELQEKGIRIIEDISYIVGVEEGSSYLGSEADVAILGLNENMMMTIGKGAAVLSNNRKIYDQMKDLRTHSGKRSYRMRFDYTITDYQAALGIEQLGHLASILERRRQIGRYYQEAVLQMPMKERFKALTSNVEMDAFTGFPVLFDAPMEHTRKYFRSLKIETKRLLSPGPLHHLMALPESEFPNAERLFAKSLVLPLYPTMGKAALERIITALKAFH